MMLDTITENLEIHILKRIISSVDFDPDKGIPRLINQVEKLDRQKVSEAWLTGIKSAMNDKENNWYRLTKSVYTDIDEGVRKTLLENFIVTVVKGRKRQKSVQQGHNCNAPWAILMDPTSACNLHCKGCWAADYGKEMSMSYETLDDLIIQGKKLGTFAYLYSGGEPLIRKDDIIRLCKKHKDCLFLAFTNGTLIDEAFADELLKVKNFMPAISVEGFEEATDYRRGKGTYKKILKAMDILRNRKLPFGISCCYTSKNSAVIGSEEYF
jgi:sulfatase maturation enzyme AslB (radical SAM superfamily)